MKKLFVLGAMLISLFVGSLLGQDYQIIDLGTLGGSSSRANKINSKGQIIGNAETTNGITHAVLWTNGIISDLGALDGYTHSSAEGLNEAGQVVGNAYSLATFSSPFASGIFLYSGGVMQDLGSLGLHPDHGTAIGINSSNQVVGLSTVGTYNSGNAHAFVYLDGAMRDIGRLGGNFSAAFGINDQGYVVGQTQMPFGEGHAFIYSIAEARMYDLGTLGGPNSIAKEININNQIVGYSDTGNGTFAHACIWQNGNILDIDTLNSYSEGYSINKHGHVVGRCARNPHDPFTAFVYKDGNMVLLRDHISSDSGWDSLEVASGINDSGQIVGLGRNRQGQFHAFLLNPITPTPVIIRQPLSQTVTIGSTVRLKVIATNSPTSYQWFFGTNLIEGATSSTLTLTNVQQSQSGAYTVVVSNLNGSVTSDPAMLSVLPGLGIDMVPRISLAGEVGLTYRLEYVNSMGPTGAWNTLTTISITNNPQFYYDDSALGQPARFYRLVGSP